MTELIADLIADFPLSRQGCPYSPPAEYRKRRELAPISRVLLPDGSPGWVLTRYEDLRTLLTDPGFSADRGHPGFPFLMWDGKRVVASQAIFPFPFPIPGFDGGASPDVLVDGESPGLGENRGPVLAGFAKRRLEGLRPEVQQIVDAHIDDLLAGPRPVDLVGGFARPVYLQVMGAVLGVPPADRVLFGKLALNLVDRDGAGEEAVEEISAYLGGLAARKASVPSDDLLSRLVVAHRERGVSDDRELVKLALLLLVSGYETTTSMIALSVVALLENPDVLEDVVRNPGKTESAVDELLRIFTVAEVATSRIANRDVEIGGVVIKAGEAVFGLAHVANHDPEVFDRPDEIDLERSGLRHLAFGLGEHRCVGQNLARMELQIVVDSLFRRIGGLRLATSVKDLLFKEGDPLVFGLDVLPVTW
ncbi:cytochrome P450 [Lentzea sp. NPDC059081]|uniref:cytochrome P450 n=1 Tax=Lentzea sp. NPDC059081 TaxID=3346719 RepID=UPI0036C415F9